MLSSYWSVIAVTAMKSNEEEPEVTLEPQLDLSPAPRESTQLVEHRPYKFNPEARRKILVALQMGNFAGTAASYGGITQKTFINWIQRGMLAGPESEGIEKEFYDFAELCTQARANSKVGLVAIAWRHARQDGKVAIALLEKLFPEEYGRKTTVTGKIDHDHTVTQRPDYSALSDEELDTAEMLARKARREQLKDEAIDAEILK